MRRGLTRTAGAPYMEVVSAAAAIGLAEDVEKEGRQVDSGMDIGGFGEGVVPALKSAWGRTRGASGDVMGSGEMAEVAAAFSRK